jgi:hypothetical protein
MRWRRSFDKGFMSQLLEKIPHSNRGPSEREPL